MRKIPVLEDAAATTESVSGRSCGVRNELPTLKWKVVNVVMQHRACWANDKLMVRKKSMSMAYCTHQVYVEVQNDHFWKVMVEHHLHHAIHVCYIDIRFVCNTLPLIHVHSRRISWLQMKYCVKYDPARFEQTNPKKNGCKHPCACVQTGQTVYITYSVEAEV